MTRSLESHTTTLAAYLPEGKLWRAKDVPGTRFRSLLTGMAGRMRAVSTYLERFIDQVIPTETNSFIAEWERALGLPDDCFPYNPSDGPNSLRLRNIGIKLAALGVQTEADFESLALNGFGISVEVNSGIEHTTYATALPDLTSLGWSDKTARNTIVVVLDLPDNIQFTYDYPIPFGNNDLSSIICLFTKLKPAHCDIYFIAA